MIFLKNIGIIESSITFHTFGEKEFRKLFHILAIAAIIIVLHQGDQKFAQTIIIAIFIGLSINCIILN